MSMTTSGLMGRLFPAPPSAELVRLQEVESRLRALIGRHAQLLGDHPVAVKELRNVLRPGSERMLPERTGYAADCSICCPDGDPPAG